MVGFTGVTATSCGAPVHLRKSDCIHDYAQLVYILPPSVMGSLNEPVPLMLIAATWKAYSVFGVRPSIMVLPVVTTELFLCTSLSAPQVA